jgi:hypothetical protein
LFVGVLTVGVNPDRVGVNPDKVGVAMGVNPDTVGVDGVRMSGVEEGVTTSGGCTTTGIGEVGRGGMDTIPVDVGIASGEGIGVTAGDGPTPGCCGVQSGSGPLARMTGFVGSMGPKH